MAKVVLEFVFKNHKRSQEFFFGLKKGDNGFSIKDCDSSRTYDAIYNTYTNNLSIYEDGCGKTHFFRCGMKAALTKYFDFSNIFSIFVQKVSLVTI